MYTLSDVYIIYGGQNILFMVADRIKVLRESHGLTQSDVAERIGISRSSVQVLNRMVQFMRHRQK